MLLDFTSNIFIDSFMSGSQLSIQLERSPLDSNSEAEGQHSYLVQRLKYENLLKE